MRGHLQKVSTFHSCRFADITFIARSHHRQASVVRGRTEHGTNKSVKLSYAIGRVELGMKMLFLPSMACPLLLKTIRN